MSKPERVLDERPKADVTADVTAITDKFSQGITESTVHNKEPEKPRRITVQLDNGRKIVADAVDQWQDKLEKTITKFINR